MIKLRNAYYCNLKLVLIWLVIFGHWIEPLIWTSPPHYRLYRLIYLVHMPLFALLSGLFLRDSRGCLRQLGRILPLYLICQAIAVALGQAPWHTPWWTLWYLLSLCFWLAAGALLLKLRRGKWLILALSLTAGCLVGTIPWVGRPFSLSRTVVFFPWFWLGVILESDIPWHRFRLPGLAALVLVLLTRPQMSVVTLYQAAPCDPRLRLESYAYAALLGLFLLSWCPRRRFPWTRAGTDTLPAYLLHAPVVRLLRHFPIPQAWLCTCVFLYLTHKAMQWHGAYGIIGKEECPWPDSKTFTNPRASRSTGSFSP